MKCSTDKFCIYCNKDLKMGNYTYYRVREAVKPPKKPNRWVTVGYCCESCELDKKPTRKDKWKI